MKNVIGPAIKELRKEKGMTQSDLSKITGFSQNTISNHENQNRSITEKDISTYSKALNVSPQKLFDLISKDSSSELVDDVQTKKMNKIFSRLTDKGKQTVIDFSQMTYEKERIQNNHDKIYTIAAHSDDPTKTVTREEFDKINSILDEIDKKYEKE